MSTSFRRFSVNVEKYFLNYNKEEESTAHKTDMNVLLCKEEADEFCMEVESLLYGV